MKKVSIFLLSVLFVGMSACSSDDEAPAAQSDDDIIVEPNVARNTVKTNDHSTELGFFSFVRNNFGDTDIFSIGAFEILPTDPTNPEAGDGVLFFFKQIPTSNVTLAHFGGLELANNQFYLSNVEINGEIWYTPFVGDDPTGNMSVTIENGVATFTAENIELSNNNVAPITETKAVSFSVSVDVSYFDSDNTGFVELSN